MRTLARAAASSLASLCVALELAEPSPADPGPGAVPASAARGLSANGSAPLPAPGRA